MRAVVQRVSRAAVQLGDQTVGAIDGGLCVLLSVGPYDTAVTASHLAARVAELRIFNDADGKMNLDLASAGGQVLVVSQFTLHADTSRGHRPSFVRAAPPDVAQQRCADFGDALRARGLTVATGEFGADMAVEIENDGPVTIVLSSGEPPWNADAG